MSWFFPKPLHNRCTLPFEGILELLHATTILIGEWTEVAGLSGFVGEKDW
jgi:hypothetical protein